MRNVQRALPSKLAQQCIAIHTPKNGAACAGQLVVLPHNLAAAFDAANRGAGREFQSVDYPLARVQSAFADHQIACVAQQFAIRRDRATIAECVGNEVPG
jgi:hypothetical protein